jgi:alcohol dehydrogenase YqhD (iron-dependent ADH family)
MQNFDLYLPTHLVFGKDRIAELPKLVAGSGKKVLLTYGGGSIKKSGLYDRVRTLLKDYEIFECAGIEPNPQIASVRRGVETAKKEGVDFIVAVGGGSVLDASKAIAAGAFYDGDPWDLVKDHSKVGKALPIFAVMTLAATGSEYDAGGVISNAETDEKMAIMSGALFPKAAILDPQYTFTVNPWHTAAGASDILSHTFEQYFVMHGNELTDGFCEGMMRTVFKYAPVAVKDPTNYEARAQLMMASSFGCCGLLAIGRDPSPWVCHGIEHEVSAYYNVTHGAGLAVITPVWMRYSLNEQTAPVFANYGVRVWGLDPSEDKMTVANKAIDKTAEFFKSIGMPSRLSEMGVDGSHFEEMADHVRKVWGDMGTAIRPLGREDIVAILRQSL